MLAFVFLVFVQTKSFVRTKSFVQIKAGYWLEAVGNTNTAT